MKTKDTVPGNPKKSSSLKKLTVLLLAVTLLAGALWSLTPLVLQFAVQKWLERTDVTIGSVEFSPLAGELTLHDVGMRDPANDNLRLENVALRLNLRQLWSRRIELDSLQLRGGAVDIRRSDDGVWNVGSFQLGGPADQEESAGEGWSWSLDHLDLSSVTLAYRAGQIDETVLLKRLEVRNLGETGKTSTPFKVTAGLDGAEIDIEGTLDSAGAATIASGTLRGNGIPLPLLQPLLADSGMTATTGTVTAELDFAAELNAAGGDSFDVSGTLTVNGAELQRDELHFAGGELEINGDLSWQRPPENSGAAAKGATASSDAPNFTGRLRLGDLLVTDTSRELVLASARETTVGTLSFADGTLTLAELRATPVELFQKTGSGADETPQPSYLLTAERLWVAGVSYRPARLDISKLVFSGGRSHLRRLADGSIELAGWFSGPEEERSRQPDELVVILNDVSIDEDHTIAFVDEQFQPPFTRNFVVHVAGIDRVDTSAPAQAAPFSFTLTIGQYSELQLAGRFSPLEPTAELVLAGHLSSLDLPPVSRYVEENLDYRLTRGHLNSDIDWRMINGQVDTKFDMVLTQLDFERLKASQSYRFDQLLGMPVKTALGLLRNRDGDIHLQLRLDGKASEIQLSVHGLLARALKSAVQKSAYTYLAPLGVELLLGTTLPPGTLYVAEKVIDWAMTMRFEPIEFTPQQTEPDASMQDYLDQLAQRLKERPDVRLVLDSKLSRLDLEGFAGAAQRERTVEEEAALMRRLAEERAAAVKNALVERGVAAERIFISAPTAQKDPDAPPRVDIFA